MKLCGLCTIFLSRHHLPNLISPFLISYLYSISYHRFIYSISSLSLFSSLPPKRLHHSLLVALSRHRRLVYMKLIHSFNMFLNYTWLILCFSNIFQFIFPVFLWYFFSKFQFDYCFLKFFSFCCTYS